MTNEEIVKQKYPDAEVYVALFAGGRYAIGSPSKGVTVGAAFDTQAEAWADAAKRTQEPL